MEENLIAGSASDIALEMGCDESEILAMAEDMGMFFDA
jgi:hypothetical protein